MVDRAINSASVVLSATSNCILEAILGNYKSACTGGQSRLNLVRSLPVGSQGNLRLPSSSRHAFSLPHLHLHEGPWRIQLGCHGSSHFWMKAPCPAYPGSCQSFSSVEVRSDHLDAWLTASPSNLGVHLHQ